MDIFTHAVVGAVAGLQVNHPIVGAIAGVMPDVVLGVNRKLAPNIAYKLTHSLLICAVCSLLLIAYTPYGVAVLAGWLSHIILDIPTHGKQWAPMPLYPFSNFAFRYFNEWEWLDATWFKGLALAISFILICVYFN